MARHLEILAHRTGAALAPGNSLAGMEFCHMFGADGFECDVTLCGDEPFIWADDSNQVLPRKISSLAAIHPQEIRGFRRKDCGEAIMELSTLWQFMDLHPDVKVYFDLKFYGDSRLLPEWPLNLADAEGHFRKVSPLMVKSAIESIVRSSPHIGRIGFTTFLGGIDLLRAVKKYNPRIFTDLILIFPWSSIEGCGECVDSVTIGWKNINIWKYFPAQLSRLIEEARRLNLRVYGGVVNSYAELLWLLARDFDGLWTDNVPYMRYLLSKEGRPA